MRVLNNYTDEFRANVVAVVRHGLKIRDVAARLNLSTATIYGWVQSDKFASVPPAGDEVMKALPTSNETRDYKSCSSLVQITKSTSNPACDNPVKISYGKLSIEFSNSITEQDLKTVISALGGIDVL